MEEQATWSSKRTTDRHMQMHTDRKQKYEKENFYYRSGIFLVFVEIKLHIFQYDIELLPVPARGNVIS